MLKRLLAVFTATFIALAGIAFAAELRQDHPSTYVVRKGDTLWDISARFLKKPWLWPEIWQANPQVKNPHLIYPGDVLSLVYIGGRPYVSGPQVHTGEPIGTVPLSQIEAFLKELTVVDDAKSLPYVIGLEEDRLRSAGGQVVYVRGMTNPQPGQLVQLARPMQEYYRGKNFSFASDLNFRGERWDTGWGQHWAAGTGAGGAIKQNTPKGKRSLLGVELAKMALGEITQVQGEVAVVVLQGNGTEVREGDRVLPVEAAPYDASFMPTPATNIRADARILSITDALRYSGPRNVIALSVGSEDGVRNGTTFSLWHDGAFRSDNVKYKNAFKAKKEGLAMPDDFLGHAMVFRTFNKVSYALIMDGIRPAQVGDLLKHPDATQ
ncbi:MAG: LysM peptidoglycan-binding domain-containing protein [Arenimonas sp.]